MDTPQCNRRAFVSAAAILGTDLALSATDATAEKQPAGTKKTILAIGAHEDDAEYCAGGLLLKAVQAGHRVVIVQACGDYSNWPPVQGREREFRQGVERVAREMGVEKIFLPCKIHEVPVDLAIKRRIAEIAGEVKPDIAVLMTENDYWTDHANIARAGKDGIMFAHGYLGKAVKRPAVLLRSAAGVNQTYEFRPDTFVDVTDVIDRVAKVLNEFDGLVSGQQRYLGELTLYGPGGKGVWKKINLGVHADGKLAELRRWGTRCGCRYAEAFETIQYTARELW